MLVIFSCLILTTVILYDNFNYYCYHSVIPWKMLNYIKMKKLHSSMIQSHPEKNLFLWDISFISIRNVQWFRMEWFCFCRSNTDSYEWEKVPWQGLKGRYEHAAFLPTTQNDKVFVFGGADQSGNLNDLQVLDLRKFLIPWN